MNPKILGSMIFQDRAYVPLGDLTPEDRQIHVLVAGNLHVRHEPDTWRPAHSLWRIHCILFPNTCYRGKP